MMEDGRSPPPVCQRSPPGPS